MEEFRPKTLNQQRGQNLPRVFYWQGSHNQKTHVLHRPYISDPHDPKNSKGRQVNR